MYPLNIIFADDVENELNELRHIYIMSQNPDLVMGARQSVQCIIECRRTYDNIRGGMTCYTIYYDMYNIIIIGMGLVDARAVFHKQILLEIKKLNHRHSSTHCL